MNMRNEEKIRKQKNSLGLRILIKYPGCLPELAAVAGLMYAFGATIRTAIAIYLVYKILMLVMRLIGQIFSIVFSVVSIAVLILIISLLIF